MTSEYNIGQTGSCERVTAEQLWQEKVQLYHAVEIAPAKANCG